jgi:hypothetical protein
MRRALYRTAPAPVPVIDSPACIFGLFLAIAVFGFVVHVATLDCLSCGAW